MAAENSFRQLLLENSQKLRKTTDDLIKIGSHYNDSDRINSRSKRSHAWEQRIEDSGKNSYSTQSNYPDPPLLISVVVLLKALVIDTGTSCFLPVPLRCVRHSALGSAEKHQESL